MIALGAAAVCRRGQTRGGWRWNGTRRVTIKPLPEMSLWDGLYGICLSHGYRHIGEIEYARGVIGIGGVTI